MKAVVKTSQGVGNVELMDVPEPQCGTNQVKIRVRAAGICGTDIHIWKGQHYSLHPPVIIGHEFSGEIVEVGSSVTRFQPGDRVTANPSAGRTCSVCRYCKSGKYFFCVDRAALGSGMDGGFAEFCVVNEDIVYRIPDNVDFDTAALTEPLACCVQAVGELSQIASHEVVLVSGSGPIGLICARLCKLQGATVILCGASGDASRLEFGRKLGIDRVVNVEQEDVVAIARDMTRGYGADVVLECAGVPASIDQCLDAIAPLGRYTQVGYLGHSCTVNFDKILCKQLTVQGSMCHDWRTWDNTLRLLETETIDLRPFLTHKFALEEWAAAFDVVTSKAGLKVILNP